jgi:NADH dehydrogenase
MNEQAIHVLIVGGGVAGLEIATQLGRRNQARWRTRSKPYRVTLLDAGSAHVWKPMLHTIAAGTRDVYQQQVAYAAQARRAGFAYYPGTMCGLDRLLKKVTVAPVMAKDGRLLLPERRLSYDVLILAVGSQANDFHTPGVREHCWTIDSRIQADEFNRELRIEMLRALARQTELTIGIVGGGATGVELAAELVQLAEAADSYGADDMAKRLKVSLIERGERLLAAFPRDIAEAARKRLEELGVMVRTNTGVASADAGGFHLHDGGQIPAALKVWAAGVKAPEFLS